MRLIKLKDPIFHRFKEADYLNVKDLKWENKVFSVYVSIKT